MLARLAPLILLGACSRAPDMATSPLVGRWDLEHPFSPAQRSAAIARGEAPEQWDAWASMWKRSGKLEDPTQYFELHADGRAAFPVFPPSYFVSGADVRVCVMIMKEGRWEAVEPNSTSTPFRVMVPGHPNAWFDYSARFETPDRIIVSDAHGELTPRAWVRRGPE